MICYSHLSIVGVLCGSTFLDEAFSRYFEARVLSCPTVAQTKSEADIRRSLYKANLKFRRAAKPYYSGDERSPPQIFDFAGFPAEESNNFTMDEVVVKGYPAPVSIFPTAFSG